MESVSKLGTEGKIEEEKFACIAPTLNVLNNVDTFFEFFTSHKWRIKKTERYGDDGLLSMLQCLNCKLRYDLALTNVLESARTARSLEIKRITKAEGVIKIQCAKEDGFLEKKEALWGLYLDKCFLLEENCSSSESRII